MNSRIVTYAKVHEEIFVPGGVIGQLGKTLPSQNRNIRNFSMSYNDAGLLLNINGMEILVPPGNVAQVVLAGPADLKT